MSQSSGARVRQLDRNRGATARESGVLGLGASVGAARQVAVAGRDGASIIEDSSWLTAEERTTENV